MTTFQTQSGIKQWRKFKVVRLADSYPVSSSLFCTFVEDRTAPLQASRTGWNQISSDLRTMNVTAMCRWSSRFLADMGQDIPEIWQTLRFCWWHFTSNTFFLPSKFCISCLLGWMNFELIKWGQGYRASWCSLTSCVSACFRIGSHAMPGQRQSQPATTSLGQGCMRV